MHIALDGWTSLNVFSFLGIVLLYLDPQTLVAAPQPAAAADAADKDGGKKTPKRTSIKSLVLDFVKLTKAHTGEYLADKLSECLKRFDIDSKVCHVIHAFRL